MRRTRSAAVGLCAALALASCGGGDAGQPASSSGPTSGFTGSISVQVSGGDSEIEAFQTLARGFEQAYPGTGVDVLAAADPGEAIARLSTAFAGGKPPDVFLINYRRLGRFVSQGVLEPADLGTIAPGDLYQPTIDAFTFDGTLQCLPQNASSIVVYTNPALFARAGVPLPSPTWTWPDMLAAAQALAAANIEAIGFDATLRTVPPFLYSAGGDLVDNPEAPTAITLDTGPGRRALTFLTDLQATGLDAEQRAAEDPVDTFARGELGMFIDSRRAVPALREAGLAFDVLPIPADQSSVSTLNSDGWCVTKAAGNKALAQEFSRYAVSEPGATVLAKTGRTVPSLRSLAQSPVFLDPALAPPSAQVFLDVIPTLRVLPRDPAANEAEETADDLVTQFFAGNATLVETVQAVREDTESVFAQS